MLESVPSQCEGLQSRDKSLLHFQRVLMLAFSITLSLAVVFYKITDR